MYLLYSIFFTVGIILTAPYYLWRLRGHIASRSDWRERLGRLPASCQQPERGAIWVHAVSVGETLAVAGLVRKLAQLYPERKIFLSHVTPAGREAGRTRLPFVAGRFLLPLDWPWCVRAAFQRLRPSLLVVMETELWPNLLRAAAGSGAKIALVNARLSDRSFARYRLLGPIMRRVLENVDSVCAQTLQDAERFLKLGACRERVVVTGNLKFDAQLPPPSAVTQGLKEKLRKSGRGPILVAASTMPGEELLVLEAWQEIRRVYRQALLILAPRHPNRFDEVAETLTRQGRVCLRRTAWEAEGDRALERLGSAEVFLLDTIGELAGIFELADAVFMGGSLVAKGGHNILEPADWAKPVTFGPHMENFRDIAERFLSSGAAIQVKGAQELAAEAIGLLQDPTRAAEMGSAGKRILEQESGATERTLSQLKKWLDVNVAASAAN